MPASREHFRWNAQSLFQRDVAVPWVRDGGDRLTLGFSEIQRVVPRRHQGRVDQRKIRAEHEASLAFGRGQSRLQVADAIHQGERRNIRVEVGKFLHQSADFFQAAHALGFASARDVSGDDHHALFQGKSQAIGIGEGIGGTRE